MGQELSDQKQLAALLRGRDHASLYSARGMVPRDDYLQGVIGPMEHAAFAREWTSDNPLAAIPLAVAVPAYTGAKALGLTKSRSPASVDEVFGSYRAIIQGLRNWKKKPPSR